MDTFDKSINHFMYIYILFTVSSYEWCSCEYSWDRQHGGWVSKETQSPSDRCRSLFLFSESGKAHSKSLQADLSLGWIQRRGWGSGRGPFLVQTPFPGRCLGRVPVSVCDELDPDTHSYTPNFFSILTQNFILPWGTLSHLKASPFSFNRLYPKMCLISITLFILYP